VAVGRARRTLRRIGAGWAFVLCADVILIRTHVLKETYTGIATVAGFVAGGLINAVWYGSAGRPHGVVHDGRRLVSARTISGVRTIELGALMSVRLYSAMGRVATIDEYHLRDRHGVRLVIPRTGDKTIDDAVRWAATRPAGAPGTPPATVTRHARSALRLQPRSRVPQIVHLVWGLILMMAALGIPALASYVIACLLAGTSVWGAPPGS